MEQLKEGQRIRQHMTYIEQQRAERARKDEERQAKQALLAQAEQTLAAALEQEKPMPSTQPRVIYELVAGQDWTFDYTFRLDLKFSTHAAVAERIQQCVDYAARQHLRLPSGELSTIEPHLNEYGHLTAVTVHLDTTKTYSDDIGMHIDDFFEAVVEYLTEGTPPRKRDGVRAIEPSERLSWQLKPVVNTITIVTDQQEPKVTPVTVAAISAAHTLLMDKALNLQQATTDFMAAPHQYRREAVDRALDSYKQRYDELQELQRRVDDL